MLTLVIDICATGTSKQDQQTRRSRKVRVRMSHANMRLCSCPFIPFTDIMVGGTSLHLEILKPSFFEEYGPC